MPLPVLVEVAVGDDGAEPETAWAPGVLQRAPVMSIRSLIRNLAAPSMMPVAICQPLARAGDCKNNGVTPIKEST